MAANSPRQVKWEDLGIVTGKTVAIVMPGGVVVTGQATAVEPDALLLRVRNTSDSKAYPKGPLRIPRAGLHTLELKTKGYKFRVIGTVLGGIAGFAGGAAAAYGLEGGLFHDNHPTGSVAAFVGITAAGVTAGYFAGNAGDRHSVMIEILP